MPYKTNCKMRGGDRWIREGRWMSFIERLKLENDPKSTRSAGKLFQRFTTCSAKKLDPTELFQTAALVQSNCVETSQFLAGCETLKQSVKRPWCQSVVCSKGRDQRRRNFEDRNLQFWSSELRRRPDQQNGDDDDVSTLPRLE